ncbi:MAG: hypothetical protein COZ07_03680 [Candidatus Infernicultor aquiphilus]|uniref:GmrSD restriction endonucleases N-terminal domain-containing protein n=3 Tax=Candidatus Infernicultor aquiphilus TaxID=1805029 RepID=A0A2M7PRQ3_9BACT|nr:DUF262 domain-containing protein [bacterium]PIU25777.1 MAG: hypothetical protein COT11_01005 [Candidatus Atribacteria bacterium CG08_land_8_20_14_0_20_33_29]PIY33024.1 MAG: hypothetical protein COZ07_03680 [Candidatus Atribacteria bacterium CG_4_10_14_3_um_filter_34_13]
MLIHRYSVNQRSIQALLVDIKSNEIAVPEIQRPFVWNAIKVRDLIDSLYEGFPIGYLIAWHNPSVRLKDGTKAKGKKILIDGQQRVTALMTALLGEYIVDKDYRRVKIIIAFNPKERKFEVSNPAICKDKSWIADISKVLSPNVKVLELVNEYCENNEGSDQDEVFNIAGTPHL